MNYRQSETPSRKIVKYHGSTEYCVCSLCNRERQGKCTKDGHPIDFGQSFKDCPDFEKTF